MFIKVSINVAIKYRVRVQSHAIHVSSRDLNFFNRYPASHGVFCAMKSPLTPGYYNLMPTLESWLPKTLFIIMAKK